MFRRRQAGVNENLADAPSKSPLATLRFGWPLPSELMHSEWHWPAGRKWSGRASTSWPGVRKAHGHAERRLSQEGAVTCGLDNKNNGPGGACGGKFSHGRTPQQGSLGAAYPARHRVRDHRGRAPGGSV